MLERICNGGILFLVSAHHPWTTELPHEITQGQLLLNNSVLVLPWTISYEILPGQLPLDFCPQDFSLNNSPVKN